ncbi:MAG: hypothetical protein JEZ02_04310 [Desulfatibacillum sp.]|nr:hypothetical protein [Desulfatibacillum sp.]
MNFKGMAMNVLIFTTLALLTIPADSVMAKPFGDVMEHVGLEGIINWTQGYLEAKGTGIPPEKYEKFYGKPQARSLAFRAAQLAAHQNLLEVSRAVRIHSTFMVKDSMGSKKEVLDQVESMAKGAQMVHREYLSDGTVEVTLRMPLLGGFTQLFLPPEFRTVPDVKAVSSPKETEVAAQNQPVGSPSQKPEETLSKPGSQVFTGMVVDARGIGVNPAMAPNILDEDGREVFGSTYVSREFAVHQGMAGYAKDMTAAREDKRVAGKPLTVKGVKTEGQGKSNVIISKADADLIRGASENLTLLKQCRVIIVME